MFDHSHYDAMRERLGCSVAFPEVFDKVRKRGFDLPTYLAGLRNTHEQQQQQGGGADAGGAAEDKGGDERKKQE